MKKDNLPPIFGHKKIPKVVLVLQIKLQLTFSIYIAKTYEKMNEWFTSTLTDLAQQHFDVKG